jgi:phosphonate transport system substrate-binding protein
MNIGRLSSPLLRLVASVLLVSVSIACAVGLAPKVASKPNSASARPGASETTSPAQWPMKLVLGMVPTEGSSDVITRFKPLADHLERVLGIPVESKSSSDYAGMITAMAGKHVDLVYMGPKAYIEAADRASAQAIAMEIAVDGQPGYRGVILAKKDSGFKTISDIKGKTMAFVDPNSTSGYLVPLMHFTRDLNTDPKTFFRDVRFAGSHQAALLAVKNGGVDAGATNDLDMGRIVASGQVTADEFVVLWKSELIPGSPMVVRKDLPESLKAAIVGALVSITDDPETVKAIGNGGYTYANDASYDVMRYLVRMGKDGAAPSPAQPAGAPGK